MSDPFISLTGKQLLSINFSAISNLSLNCPAQSDHIGIAFNLDLETFFSTKFSEMASNPPRLLTSGNKRSTDDYIKYIVDQIQHYKLYE
jgi:hypothetical protein